MVTLPDIFQSGCGSWSSTSTFYNANSDGASENEVATNRTSACKDKVIIFITDTWTARGETERSAEGLEYSNLEGAPIHAQLCEARYYMANVTISVYLGDDQPEIWFDESEFEERKSFNPEQHPKYNAVRSAGAVLGLAESCVLHL